MSKPAQPNHLFQDRPTTYAPLAERLRPHELTEFIGQEALVGPQGIVRRLLDQQKMVSLIFWGPPGSGKTTLAHIIAESLEAKFIALSAVAAGVKELRDIIEQATKERQFYGSRTIVFIDEIHRWNKGQQDALLPYIENGTITLIGATTENPSFELNAALLSRCQVVVFESLSAEQMRQLLERTAVKLQPEALMALIAFADGDARVALNTIELLQQMHSDVSILTGDQLRSELEKVALRYDKSGEEHYNLISALHKSMRASDPHAAVYWCGRMLFAGEDPLYVMRRVVEFASEDIGNADPQALVICVAAHQAAHYLGMPEGQYAILQAVTYCALAPKSRAVYNAAGAVQHDIQTTPNPGVPMHLRNASTKLMKQVGYGKGKNEGRSNLPDHLSDRRYYQTP